MLEKYEGKVVEGVYACYVVTPQTHKILEGISAKIIDAMNRTPFDTKPEMKVPSYHLTLEYKGKVADILSYIDEVRKKKHSSVDNIDLTRIDDRQSFVNDNLIFHLKVARDAVIPFDMQSDVTPHVTLLEIEPDISFPLFFQLIWNPLVLPEIALIREEAYRDLEPGSMLELDTSKVQIRGKVDGEKRLIVEV